MIIGADAAFVLVTCSHHNKTCQPSAYKWSATFCNLLVGSSQISDCTENEKAVYTSVRRQLQAATPLIVRSASRTRVSAVTDTIIERQPRARSACADTTGDQVAYTQLHKLSHAAERRCRTVQKRPASKYLMSAAEITLSALKPDFHKRVRLNHLVRSVRTKRILFSKRIRAYFNVRYFVRCHFS